MSAYQSKNQENTIYGPTVTILNHVRNIGMTSLVQYLNWCRKYNFDTRIKKTKSELQQELKFQRTKSKSISRKCDKVPCLKNTIERIYNRDISFDDLRNPILEVIYTVFEKINWSQSTLEFFQYIESHTKLLKDIFYVQSLAELFKYRDAWIRPVYRWKPKSHKTAKQFYSLSRHLLAKYHVPEFMDKAFFNRNTLHQQWFMHIGSGQNIRTATLIPIRLSKKMSHCFMQTPSNFSIDEALYRAQILTLGGNTGLFEAFRLTRAMGDYHHNNFWATLIQFFINNPSLKNMHIGPVVDYIYNQKFEYRQVSTEEGKYQEPPPRPDFNMKGRNPRSILRDVQEWHHQLGNLRLEAEVRWERSKISDYIFKEGEYRKKDQKKWTIRQLLSNQDLLAESRCLKHCVVTYTTKCKKGISSIWTMEIEYQTGRIKKLVTIEVINESRRINQIRGKRNRPVKSTEKEIIKRWCRQEGLTIRNSL